MATKDLTFNLYGRDKSASSTMNSVGGNAQRMGASFAKAGAVVAAGLAVAGAAAVAFGIDSVKAFAEAETAQNKLNFAFETMPALAGANTSALKKLNSQLALTTRFDDDATAAAQANLAQFGLTEQQLRVMTPLLLDYAARTGKDVVDASSDLGKALLGQGRALKEVGIEFEDTGDLAWNFSNLMFALNQQVGGFAEKEGATAAGQLAILQNRFGEFQETIGAALLPSLIQLMDVFETDVMPGLEDFANWLANDGIPGVVGFVDWWNKYSTVAAPAAVIALAAVTAGMIALNVAMAANPIGVVIAGLIAGIAWWTSFGAAVTSIVGTVTVYWGLFQAAGINAMAAVGAAVNFLMGPLNGLINLINIVTGSNLSGVYIPTMSATYTPAAAAAGGRTGGRKMAEGGIVPAQPGGIFANIGEGRHDEVVFPLTDRNLSALGGGGGGVNVTVNVTGIVASDAAAVGKFVYKAITDARRTGVIPAGAI